MHACDIYIQHCVVVFGSRSCYVLSKDERAGIVIALQGRIVRRAIRDPVRAVLSSTHGVAFPNVI